MEPWNKPLVSSSKEKLGVAIMIALILGWLAFWVGVIYVAVHFIRAWW